MNLHDLSERLSAQDLVRLFRAEPERSSSETLLGSLALLGAGALIGATVALFLSPRAGAEMREELRDCLRSTGETLAGAVRAGTARAREA